MFELINVLLVEGDALIGNKLQLKLKGDRFNSKWVGSLTAANEIRQHENFDIFIISSVLPDGSGQTLIHELGKKAQAPIKITLLESNSTSKIVEAFKFGSDDVLCKPIQYPELLARIQAILRRSKPIEKSLILHGDICVDLEGKMVTKNDEVVNLSAKEFAILKILIKNTGLIFSKQQLEEKIYEWGEDIGSNALEVHISHLRKKLGKSLITTFRNMGYVIKRASETTEHA